MSMQVHSVVSANLKFYMLRNKLYFMKSHLIAHNT